MLHTQSIVSPIPKHTDGLHLCNSVLVARWNMKNESAYISESDCTLYKWHWTWEVFAVWSVRDCCNC